MSNSKFPWPNLEKNSDLRLLAHIVSAVFQPLLMPTLVFYTLLFHIDDSTQLTEEGRRSVLTLIFLSTFLIPLLLILLFRFIGIIKSLQMTNRHDRWVPFLLVTLFYLAVTFIFHKY